MQFGVRNAGDGGHLALGSELLLVAVGGVSWDLTGPEVQAHHKVSTAHHQQRQEVDQDGHTHMVPATHTHAHTSLVIPELQKQSCG